MSTISIIGAGNMAAAIGGRAAQAGHTVEVISRDAGQARRLVEQLGQDATVGTFGEQPIGDIVIVAVQHAGAVEVVSRFGAGLSGKTVIDITNPFNADGSGLTTGPGDSITQRIADAAPDAHVVKAFNTIYGGAISSGEQVAAFFAGDDVDAKARVAEFLQTLGLRPLDAGGLEMAHALEWAGLMLVGVSRNGAGFDVALAIQAL